MAHGGAEIFFLSLKRFHISTYFSFHPPSLFLLARSVLTSGLIVRGGNARFMVCVDVDT